VGVGGGIVIEQGVKERLTLIQQRGVRIMARSISYTYTHAEAMSDDENDTDSK
jgi:hypothetical protein